MRSIHEKTERALLLLVALCALLACRANVTGPIGERRDVQPQRGGVLRTAFFTNVRTLDAATAFDTASAALEGLIYDTLVSYDDAGKIVPLLAESVDVSADGKRFTFTLRKGVRFQDGSELTARDVKRSLERALHADTPCPVASFYDRIAGYDEYRKGKAAELSGVKLAGRYTVEIALSDTDATFLHVMALPIAAPVCPGAGKTWDAEFGISPCGAGPFRVTRFEHGRVVELRRHDGYWQKGKPYLDGVEWQLGMPAFTQRFEFESGGFDYMREFSDADSLLYRTHPAWKGHGAWASSMTTAGLFMNTQRPPFDNRHLRRAVSYALRAEHIAAIRQGHVWPHRKVVPGAIIESTPGYPGQRHDPKQALAEMKAAGYPYDPSTGEGGYPEEIEYVALLESFGQQAAEIYQQQLARIGIRIRLQLVSWPTFLTRTGRRGEVAMGTSGWHADYPHATNFFEPILTTKAISDENSQNLSFFSNRELDELVRRARRTPDDAEVRRLIREAETIVAREAPWVTSYEYRYFELWHPYLHGYRPHPVLSQHVRDVWLDLEARRDDRRARATRPCFRLVPGTRDACRPATRSALAAVGGR